MRTDTVPVDEPAAWCRDVVKIYSAQRNAATAVHRVSKDVAAGKLTVVAGPSGCGKSTLLRILACLDRPTSGVVALAGHSIGDATDRMRRRLRRTQLGYLFADPADNLVEYLTAAEQVRLAGQLRGRKVTDPGAILERFGLGHRLEHRPSELSGGEQQRTSIACALVSPPTLVVADEPTAEIDSVAAGQVLDGVRVLCDAGSAFVIASHDPRVIERADHLLRLDRGRTVESW